MVYLILIALLVGADQWVKSWTVGYFAAPVTGVTTADAPRAFLPGLVELTRVHNDGAAWSSFSGMRWMLVGLTAVLIVVMAMLLIRGIVRHPVGRLAVSLIIAGGIGNLIDRCVQGYVVDMFNFTFIRFPVFNVADVCVVIGAIFGGIYYLWLYEKYDAKKGNPQ